MSNLKEKEGGGLQKEEANIVLQVSCPETLSTIADLQMADVHFGGIT